MLQGFSNIANLMKNAKEIQARAAEMKAKLASLRVNGEAGGGMVKVEMAGDHRLTKVEIDPSLFESGDREMTEDLVLSAVNQALENLREQATGEMAALTDGMGLPDIGGLMSKFGPGGTPPDFETD